VRTNRKSPDRTAFTPRENDLKLNFALLVREEGNAQLVLALRAK
jgi:hypothetical protein